MQTVHKLQYIILTDTIPLNYLSFLQMELLNTLHLKVIIDLKWVSVVEFESEFFSILPTI